jgi:hypothetical protein
MRIWSWAIILLIFISITADCQRQAGRPTNFTPSSLSQNTAEQENDTLVYTYSTLNDISVQKVFDDTTLHAEIIPFYTSDQSRKTVVNCGNLGSAAHNLIYSPTLRMGFHTGYDQYQLYNLNENNYRLFNGNKPVSDVYFSQFANQQNIMAGANFYRPFSDGISVGINYRRISQAGLYNSQNTKTTNLGMSLRYEKPENKYSFILTYLRNINEENNNGGIVPSFDINNESIRTVIPTILNMAATRHQEQSIILDQFYKLKSGKEKKVDFIIRNRTSLMPGYFKFADQGLNTVNDTLHYGDLLRDVRGIRRYVNVSHFRNQTSFSTQSSKGYLVKAGLVYDYFGVDNSFRTESRHDVTLTFTGNFPVFKSLLLNTEGQLGVGENIGNFHTEGNLDLKLSKALILKGSVQFFRTEQSYASRVLAINFEEIFREERNKSLGTIFSADLEIPSVKLKTGLRQYLWNNPVYWDVNARPAQLNSTLTVTQMYLHQKTSVLSFVLENDAWIQFFSDDIYHLPKWMTHHRFYWEGLIFRKVLNINLGASARFIPEYKGTGYSPVTGQFYTSEEVLDIFPAVDLFIEAKVSRFRAVFTMENAGLFFSNKVNYDIARYPQLDATLRFGFRWMLLD